MYLYQKIEEVTHQKNDSRQTIGDYLLRHRQSIKQQSMQVIATATFTSKPTLVRFAQSLGYSGWREFMYAFEHEVANYDHNTYGDVDPNFPFDAEASTLEIIERLAQLRLESLKSTVNLLQPDVLDQAAQLIFKAQNVVIFGTSPNTYYGETFKRNLISIGKSTRVAPTDEGGLIANTMNPHDCALVISYSGNNPAVSPTSNLKILLPHDVPIIALTSGGDNYLRDYATVTLNISSKEKLYSKITNFATEESILFLLNSLFAKVFSLNYSQNRASKIDHSRSLESGRQASFKDILETPAD
ncbi:MurR/RpiR family transcriptional regulator [Lactobacillus sp. CBA3605]|uniref:MurR/RpiR family transcriptional regulator n=1 Tax=Lactobacillus sp. CBA3605 TaxID=2099788 RepID=UPI000CFD8CAA|nr:MurR/RpiR family transcriptional regulator [Lactobacillus sp. CBA3605]AVK61214.1 MurR/RpiR family transcriptional regulator [Lactobacillus sp. CBA3605]